MTCVALLAEGVDRNVDVMAYAMAHSVALLAEGVDRNTSALSQTTPTTSRPPRGGRG